jgi:hypothetical protein
MTSYSLFPKSIFTKLPKKTSTVPEQGGLLARFSWSHLESNKIVKENQDRGWFRDGLRCPKQVSVKSCLFLPLTKFSKVCVFSASINFKAFFYTHFVVKFHLRVQKFFVEFNDVFKTAEGAGRKMVSGFVLISVPFKI